MGPETIYLRTLTPLWTGDVDRNSAKVKETGLMGSLRWWYEGLIRGLGGFACDPTPTSEDRCELSGKERSEGERRNKLCAACYVFGCAGWAKQFRLEVEGLKPMPLFFMSYRNVYVSNGNWLVRLYGGRSQKSRPPKFQFDGVATLWAEQFAIRVIPLRGLPGDVSNQIRFLLHLVSEWGGLGAKIQNGFGQIQIMRPLPVQTVERARSLIAGNAQRFRTTQMIPDYFRFDRFFSTIYEIKDPAPHSGMELIGAPPDGFDVKAHFIPCAYDIRYKSRTYNPRTRQGQNFGLRPFFRNRFGPELTNKLLGETRPQGDQDRSASRICVSHLYKEPEEEKFKLKVWGWIPPNLMAKGKEITVPEIVKAIDEFIMGEKGMFPRSRAIRRFDFERELT